MDDLLRQLVAYGRGIWSYRWWGLGFAWIAGVAAAIGIYVLPDRYEASARIYVDTQSVLAPLMAGLAIPTNVNQQVAMLSKTLISRPNVEKLIRMADLDLKEKTDKQREQLVEDVTQRLKIQSTGRDNLYTLSFQDERPERAKRVVQSFLSIFVESGLGDKRKDTDTARRFIEDQIKNYAQKLDEAEMRLKEFKIRNLSLMADSGKDSVSQINDINTRLAQARLDLKEAEESRDAIKRQLTGGGSTSGTDELPADTDISVPELDGRIDSMKRQLDDLLRRYTDNHPDVKGTRSVLASLEKQRDEEVKSRRAKAGADHSAGSTNPLTQQLTVAVTEAEATVASLRTRVAEYEARLAQARSNMKLGPQIEQEFTQLNRDYDVTKKNYDGLVARREAASISVDMDSASGMAEFRLIDPPSSPTKPAAPNRALLMPGAGLASLLGGILFSLLLSQIRPVFYDGRSLREVTGMPLLGSVSMIPSAARLRREKQRKIAFIASVIAYGAVFLLLTLIVIFVGRPF